MGFNKKYITKESIINTLITGNSISNLVKNTDALILDNWSSNFFNLYKNDPSYNLNRKKLRDDTQFSSSFNSRKEHENYEKLKIIPNILVNLYIDPCWVDILLTIDILGGSDIPKSSIGKFEKLRTFCINKIEDRLG